MTNKLNFLKNKSNKAFTLIELLVVISIIGVLTAVSIFGLSGARESSRDARRKSDLELIKAGLELYRADCNVYPSSLTAGANLVGTGTPTACAVSNVYITGVPSDPIPASRAYVYRTVGNGYEICTALEQTTGTVSCGGVSTCGSVSCNYKVTNP